MFVNQQSNVISFLCSKDFWLGLGKRFCLERCEDWDAIARQLGVSKIPDLKTNIGVLNTLDLTQIFE